MIRTVLREGFRISRQTAPPNFLSWPVVTKEGSTLRIFRTQTVRTEGESTEKATRHAELIKKLEDTEHVERGELHALTLKQKANSTTWSFFLVESRR